MKRAKKSQFEKMVESHLLPKPPEENWGFDLSVCSPDNFTKVLSIMGATPDGMVRSPEGYFEWYGDFGVVVTGNNPYTGEYMRAGRDPEVGYCSYVGISGDKEAVRAAADAFRSLAGYTKDESPHSRDFI